MNECTAAIAERAVGAGRAELGPVAEAVRAAVSRHHQVRVAEVFKDAVRHNHPAIIVVHNHPSGDPTPSRDDVRVTKDMVQAGELLGINVLDHIVIGQQRFVSMKERGLGF